MPPITLADHLAAAGTAQPLAQLLVTVADACTRISALVGRGALAGILGEAGTENVQGETQKKLDVLCNDLLTEALLSSGTVAAVASEEMDDPQAAPAGARGPLLATFDPLDGSSNIDVNVSIGTIFSVLDAPAALVAGQAGADALDALHAAFLQPGRAQRAAGYVVYGPQTQLVLTLGKGVQSFTLERETGRWLLVQPTMTVPADTKEFAINASNARHWEAPVKRYVDEMLAGSTGVRGKDFNMRWIASMVADVHRVLNRGGVFMYPRDAREPGKPGKLRLMYEANPMSWLVEQAGGMATNGAQRILDIAPGKLHERVAVFLGSRNEVDRVTSYHG